MTAPKSVDPAGFLREHLESASPDLLRAMVQTFAEALMSAEADAMCGAPYGQRSDERTNQRNGYRAREWDTRAGTVELAVPKLRSGSYFPDWLLTHRRRAEQALVSVVATSYLLGVSTRRVEKLVEQLGVKQLSKSQVSEMATHLDAQVEAFRNRPLDSGHYTFVWLDALAVKVREGGRTVNVHALVAVGVNADGAREVLGLDITADEDGAGWLAFLRSLTARGLCGVRLVISDAHRGLVAAVAAALPGAGWQRCRTHWACKESTGWCRCVEGGQGVEERGRGGESWGVGRGDVAVLGEDRAGFAYGVADGAAADLEQFSEDVLGAHPAPIEHRREDSLGIGDLLAEDAAAGAGQAFPAAAAVAVAFGARRQDVHDAFGHRGEVGTRHPGQGGVGEQVGQPGAAGVVCAA